MVAGRVSGPGVVPAGGEAGGSSEWWERLAAGLRGWRGFGVLVRLQVVGVWVALPVVVVAVVVSSELRVSLGAWVGAVWVVAAWFWMARLKTVECWVFFGLCVSVCQAACLRPRCSPSTSLGVR